MRIVMRSEATLVGCLGLYLDPGSADAHRGVPTSVDSGTDFGTH